MKLSIIIPLYNNEQYIERCLKSLISQDLDSNQYEIIIIDDGSTDSSYSVAKNYSKDYSNFYVYCQKNGGSGEARNKGLEVARGEYIYFVDSDDYIASNVLEDLLEFANSNNLEMLCFNIKYVENDSIISNSYNQNIQDISLQVMGGMDYIRKYDFRVEVWWYITKRTFLIDSGLKFPHNRFVQDANFTASLILRTTRISKVNFDVYRYVTNKNSASRNKDPNQMLKYANDLVTAIEEYNVLINSLNNSNLLVYTDVVKKMKRKQHGWVFAIFIKIFKCQLNFKDLKKILFKLKKLGVYPVSSKYGSIGFNNVYNKILMPVFNNRILLFLALRISKLINFPRISIK